LRGELTTLTEAEAKVAALDALLRVSRAGDYRFVPAEVIAVGPAQDFAWTVTIDAGRNDGVESDMTVINGDGLVGHVVKTTASTATVVLVVDAESSVGARIAGSEEIGVVSGTGDQNVLNFTLLDPMADVRKGDALVTFGSKGGRPYAPGLPIGEVVSVSGSAGDLTRVAKVRPFADMSRLTVVGVVTRPPRTDPRDSVLGTGQSPTVLSDAGSNPAPLGGRPSAGPSASSSPSPSNEVEQPATRAPAGGN
jgi:rod shape-determining protein MreC